MPATRSSRTRTAPAKPAATTADRRRLSAVYRALSKAYHTFDETDDPWVTNGLSATPFRSLVSTCLSTMTLTTRVVNACVPLYKKVSTFEELAALPDNTLRKLIKPVAHYNRKTVGLKIMSRQILDEHGGKIPHTRDELLKLHGVGRKVADIMLNFVFSEPSIAVDTHVHRLLNRLGVVNTTSAEDTADIINVITTKTYKRHAHEWLVQHGQKVCVSRRPKCSECVVTKHCDWFHEHAGTAAR